MFNKIKNILFNIKEKGFFHLLSANFLVYLLGFLSQLLVAWILPVEDIGRIKILQSYLGILTIFSTLGFNISVLKLTSENRNPGEKKFLFFKGLKYTFITSVLTYIAIVILSLLNYVSNDKMVNLLSPFFYLTLIPLSLNTIFIAFLQGYKKFKIISKIQTISKLSSISFLVGLTFFFYIYGYIFAVIIGFIFTSLLFSFYIYKNIKTTSLIKINHPLKTHFKYSGYSTLANLTSVLANNIDILLMSYLIMDKVNFGYYSFAVTLIVILRILPQTIQQITIPYFSERSNNKKEWLKIVKKYFILSQYVNIIVLILVFFTVPYFIKLVYSGKFDNSIIYFKIILIGWFFRGAYNILGGAIIGLGDIRFNFINGLIISIFNTILMFIFIKYFNITGAAWANALGGFFAFIIVFLRFYIKYIKPNS